MFDEVYVSYLPGCSMTSSGFQIISRAAHRVWNDNEKTGLLSALVSPCCDTGSTNLPAAPIRRSVHVDPSVEYGDDAAIYYQAAGLNRYAV
jgi:hypothetical protein